MVEVSLGRLRQGISHAIPLLGHIQEQHTMHRQEQLSRAEKNLHHAGVLFDERMHSLLAAPTEEQRQEARESWDWSAGTYLDAQDAYAALQTPSKIKVLFQGVKSLLSYKL